MPAEAAPRLIARLVCLPRLAQRTRRITSAAASAPARLPQTLPNAMYAPPGADAPRAAPAEAALIKARRKDAEAKRKNWLAKNSAP